MFNLTTSLRRITPMLLIAALGITLIPTKTAAALQEPDTGNPPERSNLRARRLERIWFRQQRTHDHLDFLFDHAQQRIDRARELIEVAADNGKDVSALQAALDEFADAVQEAQQIHTSAQGLVSSHPGFDADGTVTQSAQAAETVEAMRAKLREIRDVLRSPSRALWDALRELREANRGG